MKKNIFPKKAPTLPSSKSNYQARLVSEPRDVPMFIRKASVSAIPKKGSKLLLKNERGIFIVNSIKAY